MSFLKTAFTRFLFATGLRKKPTTMPKRSDPCPCGSGKTFKDCHLPQALEEARAAKAKKTTS
jgi:uncharacterized protein YchJ